MVNTIKYFEVGDCYDAEGRGPFKVIANFTKEKDAKKYAEKRGNYGHTANVNPKVLIIADSIEEMTEYNNEAERQKALKKLTPREIEILGLNKGK